MISVIITFRLFRPERGMRQLVTTYHGVSQPVASCTFISTHHNLRHVSIACAIVEHHIVSSRKKCEEHMVLRFERKYVQKNLGAHSLQSVTTRPHQSRLLAHTDQIMPLEEPVAKISLRRRLIIHHPLQQANLPCCDVRPVLLLDQVPHLEPIQFLGMVPDAKQSFATDHSSEAAERGGRERRPREAAERGGR